MDMRSAAMASYEKAVVQYATSPVVHHANLGTMRVIYRNGDDGGVAEMFAKLNRDEVSDSLRHHARYIQGESFMRTGEYQKALQAFESIPMGHPEYMFAQHSVGVARIHEFNLDAAVEAFTNSIEGDPQTPEEQEIANRSYLLVGFLFYERLSLNQAVAALRRVPETSYYYQDALLGLGWAAVKARQWGDCLEASLKLQSVSTRIPVRCEGLLLQAYALMMQKRHSEALAVLEAAQRETVDFEAPTDRELNERQNAADERRWEYDELAREVLEVSGQVGSSKQLANITDSLHRRQETLYDTLLAFQKYVDEHARSAFFARNMQTIRDDIDYAHAIVTKAVSGVAVREQAEKMYEEQKSLDEEIEMLQDQLEKDSGPAEGDSEEF
jgi:tetratricopeptide (TPR) repeat protein